MPYEKYRGLLEQSTQPKSSNYALPVATYEPFAPTKRTFVHLEERENIDDHRHSKLARGILSPTVYGYRNGHTYAERDYNEVQNESFVSTGTRDHSMPAGYGASPDMMSLPITPMTPAFPQIARNNYVTGTTNEAPDEHYQYPGGASLQAHIYPSLQNIDTGYSKPGTLSFEDRGTHIFLPKDRVEETLPKQHDHDSLEKELSKLLCESSGFYKDSHGKYKCPSCPNSYKYFKHLKRHCIGHTGERPHTCQKCNYRFCRSDIKSRHEKRCTGKLKTKESLVCILPPTQNYNNFSNYRMAPTSENGLNTTNCSQTPYSRKSTISDSTGNVSKRDFSDYPGSELSGLMIQNLDKTNHIVSPPSSVNSVSSENGSGAYNINYSNMPVNGFSGQSPHARYGFKSPMQPTYDYTYTSEMAPSASQDPQRLANSNDYYTSQLHSMYSARGNTQQLHTQHVQQQPVPYNMMVPYLFASSNGRTAD